MNVLSHPIMRFSLVLVLFSHLQWPSAELWQAVTVFKHHVHCPSKLLSLHPTPFPTLFCQTQTQNIALLTFSLTYLLCFFPSRTLSWRRKLLLLPSDGQYRYVMSGHVLFHVPLSLALLSSHLKNQSPLTNFMDWSGYGETSQPVGWGHQLG